MHFQEDTQSEILRCAQDDNRGAFFRSLLKSGTGLRKQNESLAVSTTKRQTMGIVVECAAPSSTATLAA